MARLLENRAKLLSGGVIADAILPGIHHKVQSGAKHASAGVRLYRYARWLASMLVVPAAVAIKTIAAGGRPDSRGKVPGGNGPAETVSRSGPRPTVTDSSTGRKWPIPVQAALWIALATEACWAIHL